MTYDYLDLLSTASVRAAQVANGSAALWSTVKRDRPSAEFTEAEAAFIAARDSFYMASTAENGWPYVQHRGGPPGFLKVLDETHLGFADFRGNRQYITLGNTAADDRVSLILVDYPNRQRLKILARLAVRDFAAEPDLARRLDVPGYRAIPERGMVLTLEAFDWNCPQHITPRFTLDELEPGLAAMRARIAELESEVEILRRGARHD